MKVSLVCMHNLGEWIRWALGDNSHHVWTHEKHSGDAVCWLGTIKAFSLKHFLSLIRSQHSVDHLEMVWWVSWYPRGSSACTWKSSSHLFSWPNWWLLLGLRGWIYQALFLNWGDRWKIKFFEYIDFIRYVLRELCILHKGCQCISIVLVFLCGQVETFEYAMCRCAVFENGEKNLCFQKYKDTCRCGLD